MKYKIFIYLFVLPLLLNAQTFRNYSNEFLNIGVDAAALGMSKTVVATTNNVNAIYWNPAGLVGIEDYQGSLMHASYFAGIANYNHAAFAMPIDAKSALGISIIRFGVDDILDTTKLIDQQGIVNYDRINLFSAADYALTFSYARKLPLNGLNYGVNAKVIRRIIGDFASSWGFGLDLGIQFESNGWQFGLMARDITTTFNAWAFDEDRLKDIQNAIPGENQEEPATTELTLPKLQLGIAKLFTFNYDYTLRTELDLIARFEQNNDLISTSFVSVNPALGFEFAYIDLVFLRAGLGNFQNELQIDNSSPLTFQPNFGLGFKYNGFQLDYAFTDIGDQSAALYSNVFSLKIDLSIFR
ncbi:PorV/PorQ family protein [Polaribacter sp.]|uniref:putative type IX sorting system protein PorV2 n=1 Tax=Polaribacter sp. TaxID=1920175 RepID=UPI002633FBA9|nr:PorV/PorQ family protein [Polaribacter sp.]MDG1402508.1 PorV/PorQ family protein [Polaribacter sp.]